jgi:hypothetical protein
VKDLAVAFKMMLGNEKARGQIYNISGERCDVFDYIKPLASPPCCFA